MKFCISTNDSLTFLFEADQPFLFLLKEINGGVRAGMFSTFLGVVVSNALCGHPNSIYVALSTFYALFTTHCMQAVMHCEGKRNYNLMSFLSRQYTFLMDRSQSEYCHFSFSVCLLPWYVSFWNHHSLLKSRCLSCENSLGFGKHHTDVSWLDTYAGKVLKRTSFARPHAATITPETGALIDLGDDVIASARASASASDPPSASRASTFYSTSECAQPSPILWYCPAYFDTMYMYLGLVIARWCARVCVHVCVHVRVCVCVCVCGGNATASNQIWCEEDGQVRHTSAGVSSWLLVSGRL